MKENKPQKYIVISKEVEVDKLVEGEMAKVIEPKDFVQETIIIQHEKDEFLQNKQNEIGMLNDEIARLQARKADIEADIAGLSAPNIKK